MISRITEWPTMTFLTIITTKLTSGQREKKFTATNISWNKTLFSHQSWIIKSPAKRKNAVLLKLLLPKRRAVMPTTRTPARRSKAPPHPREKRRSSGNVTTIHWATITVLQPKQQAKLRCSMRVSLNTKMMIWFMFPLNFKEMAANVRLNATRLTV